MECLRKLIRRGGVVLSLAIVSSGCVTTTTDNTLPPRTPEPAKPAKSTSLSVPSLSSLTTMVEGPKAIPVTEMAAVWSNRIAYLPDPTRNGRPGAGLAGQVILLGAELQFAPANGTLTVDVFDETPRQPGGPQALVPERWQFTAADLKKLEASDERFGRSYTLFLPWLAYRADVTRVRIMARYDPADGGHPLFAPASTLTIDTTPQNGSSVWSGGTQVVPAVTLGGR